MFKPIIFIDSCRENASNIFSETNGPIKAKFRVEPQWVGGMRVCSPHLGHLNQRANGPGAWYAAVGSWVQ